MAGDPLNGVTCTLWPDSLVYLTDDSSNGLYVFDDLTPKAIANSVGWAVWAWYNRPEDILAMRVRAMQQRFSWDASATRYVELYRWAIDRRVGRTPRT